MIARLKKVDPTLTNKVDQPMLLRNAPRPDTRPQIFQRLGLANADKRFTDDHFDEIEDPKRHRPIGLNPMAEILAELRVENCFATTRGPGSTRLSGPTRAGQPSPRAAGTRRIVAAGDL
jgi:hypothetical protein